MEELLLVVGQPDLLLLAGSHPHPVGGPRTKTMAGEQDAQDQNCQEQ